MIESRIVPLSGGFMITSIVGFIISAMYLYPNSEKLGISPGWAFTFMLFFVVMFISSMISMTYGPEPGNKHAPANASPKTHEEKKK